jgi:hypothetical protein
MCDERKIKIKHHLSIIIIITITMDRQAGHVPYSSTNKLT